MLNEVRLLVSALYQSARTLEHRTGMTNAQMFLLRQLAEQDCQTINELAERAMTRQSAMSLLVTRLEGSGHVRRVRSQRDRRQVEVEITAAGRRAAARSPEAPMERILAALGELDHREVAALDRGLGALLDAMNVERSAAPLMFEQRDHDTAELSSRTGGRETPPRRAPRSQ